MVGPFFARTELILRWLNAKGHTGTCHDALMKYFQGKSTSESTSLYDLVGEALSSAGY